MSTSTINIPISRATATSQWGVFDSRKGKVIRSSRTRRKARNYARRSKFYSVVSRPILVGYWE